MPLLSVMPLGAAQACLLHRRQARPLAQRLEGPSAARLLALVHASPTARRYSDRTLREHRTMCVVRVVCSRVVHGSIGVRCPHPSLGPTLPKHREELCAQSLSHTHTHTGCLDGVARHHETAQSSGLFRQHRAALVVALSMGEMFTRAPDLSRHFEGLFVCGASRCCMMGNLSNACFDAQLVFALTCLCC